MVSLQPILVWANKDFTIDTFSQNLHGIDIAIACPNRHYVEIEPWCKPTNNHHRLTIHGMYDKSYMAELKLLIAKPFSKKLTIKKRTFICQSQKHTSNKS